MLIILLLLLFLNMPLASQTLLRKACLWNSHNTTDYYQPGDFIVGGNLPLGTCDYKWAEEFRSLVPPECTYISATIIKNYQPFRAFTFAITELNKDPTLLPNMTLGFSIYEHKDLAKVMHENGLSLLSTRGKTIPNYKCDKKDHLHSVLGGLDSKSSREIASLMGIYKIPQLGYGLGAHFPKERGAFPSFFQIDPYENPQYEGLVQLLLHFSWNWVGFLVQKDESGENFIRSLTPMLQKKDICIAFTDMIRTTDPLHLLRIQTGYVPSSWFGPEVIVVFGSTGFIAQLMRLLSVQRKTKIPFWKTWIITSHWEISVGIHQDWPDLQTFHGALQFQVQRRDVTEFKHVLPTLDPLRPQGDIFLHQWWEAVFQCSFQDPEESSRLGVKKCSGKEKIESLPRILRDMRMSSRSYNIYNGVYAVAHALHSISASKRGVRMKGEVLLNFQPWQVQSFFSWAIRDDLVASPWSSLGNKKKKHPKEMHSP